VATLDIEELLLELLLELEEELLEFELLLELPLILEVENELLELLLDPTDMLELVELELPPLHADTPNVSNTSAQRAGVEFNFNFSCVKTSFI
jgi:hypothetical protein